MCSEAFQVFFFKRSHPEILRGLVQAESSLLDFQEL